MSIIAKNLLYIRLFKEQGFFYGIPNGLDKGFKQTFDLDNFSDNDVVNSAVNFLNQDTIKVILECEPTAPINKLLHLFNALRELENTDLQIIGEHQMTAYLKQ